MLNFITLALLQQMGRLKDLALVGGERSDAADHCLAGIARLSKEVQDASSYVPAYDQRTYGEVSGSHHPQRCSILANVFRL